MQYKLKPVSMSNKDYKAELAEFKDEDDRHEHKVNAMKLFFMDGSKK
jgi:hypothetical protein